MTRLHAPLLIPAVNVCPRNRAHETGVIVLAEHRNGVARLLKLAHELCLLQGIGEVIDGFEHLVAGIGPVEDSGHLSQQFRKQIDITLLLFRFLRIRRLYILAWELNEAQTTAQTVDNLGRGHRITGVHQLAPRDKVHMGHALIAGLHRGAIGDFQQPFTDLTLGKVAVDIGTHIQKGVLQANALKLLGKARGLYMGDIGVSEQLLNDFQIDGFSVTAIAHQDKHLLEPAVGEQHIAGQRLQYVLTIRIFIGDIPNKVAPGGACGLGVIVVFHDDGAIVTLGKVPEAPRVNLQRAVLERHHRVAIEGNAADSTGFQQIADGIDTLRRGKSLAVHAVRIVFDHAIGDFAPNLAIPLIETHLVHVNDVMGLDDFIHNLGFRGCRLCCLLD